MDFVVLIWYLSFAVYFTVTAFKETYDETVKLCRISAFVWWLIAAIQIIQMIAA